jgi:hypothetical protein
MFNFLFGSKIKNWNRVMRIPILGLFEHSTIPPQDLELELKIGIGIESIIL